MTFQEKVHPRGRDGKFVASFDAPLGHITGTRSTKREYTHAVVMHWPDAETRDRARVKDREEKEYLRPHRTPEEFEKVLAVVDERHSTPGHVLSFHGSEAAAHKAAEKSLRDLGATGRRYKVVATRPATLREAALFTGKLHPRDRAGRFRLVKGASGPSAVELAKRERARSRRRAATRAEHRSGEGYNTAAQRMGYGPRKVKRFSGREDSMMGDKVLEALDYFEASKLRLILEGRSEGDAVNVAVTAGVGRFGATFPEMVEVGRELFEAELVELAEDAALQEALSGPHESLGHGKNWVTKQGGLPAAISRLAKDLMEEKGIPKSRAIAMAIGIMKRWARGGGDVKPKTRATAAKAVAQWEAMKAKAHAS